MSSHSIEISKLGSEDMIVGYIAMVKVMDKEGGYYWATRGSSDLNDMEKLGMATDMVNCFTEDLREGKESL